MRAGVATALAGAVVASFVLAVGASASPPPNAVPGFVTLTVTKEPVPPSTPGGLAGPVAPALIFQYTVKQKECGTPDTGCPVNYAHPYNISIGVVGPDGASGIVGNPNLVDPPSQCFGTSSPVVSCDSGRRDYDDPAAALPMSGTFKVVVPRGVRSGSTAEIVVEGYSFSTYQEGVAVPAIPDCQKEANAFSAAGIGLSSAEQRYRDKLHELVKIENAALIRLRIGEIYVHLRQRAIEDFADARKDLAAVYKLWDKAGKAYGDCISKGSASRASKAAECTPAKWGALVKRGQALKLKNVAPLVRKILAEQKAKKRAQAGRNVKRLKTQLKAEAKAVNALWKAVSACK
jgi:hypothetical protein